MGKSATIALVAALGCTSQLSYAYVGIADSAIKLPSSTEIDRSLNRLNEAWSALQGEQAVRSLLKESRNALSASKRIASDRLETVKFQHYYNGLEVVGSMAMHQQNAVGSQLLNRLAQLDIDTNPRLEAMEAVAIAKSLVGDRELTAKPVLKILPEAEDNGARLVYWVDIDANDVDGAREVIVDANSGEVIGNVSKNIDIAPINVYSAQKMGTAITKNASGCTLKDLSNGQTTQITAEKCQSLQVSDLPPSQCQVILEDSPAVVIPQNCALQVQNSSPVGSDAAAIRAFRNSQAVLTYYQSRHNRNSYDNRGASPVNIVHAGIGFNNAYWNTQQSIMVYGEGDGKIFSDFTAALDVAGHEQTHGVVAYTAKLLGMGESGALNEAFADFFGKMIANDNDWAIGRKLFIDQAHAQGVRDLANPSALSFCAVRGATGCAQRKPFPSTLKEKMASTGTCDRSNDNCWVHVNSTIPSHASYLVVQAIGVQKAEQLYYAALTQSLTARDNIVTAASSIKRTCAKVLDATACNAVTQAYAQLGL